MGRELTHVDCQGLAGAWTLGSAQAGFTLIHRASLAKFGDEIIAHNRELVPGPWEQDDGNGPDEWTPQDGVSYLSGTPPCSGFSLLNRSKGKNNRGPDSPINQCMWELISYAGVCTGSDRKRGPEVVAFESVQGAFGQGRELMQKLRARLEQLTGQKYSLNHVKLSGSTVGAAQMRHRYYFVASRIPFGIDPPEPRRVATYYDAIGDLEDCTPGEWSDGTHRVDAPFDFDQTWWLAEQSIRSHLTPVADHVAPYNPRIKLILEELVPYWTPGASMTEAMRAYRAVRGKLPSGTENWWYADTDEMKGFSHERRIRPDRPGYVLTGGGVYNFIHWRQPRYLTVRECARLMGYPDAWRWDVAKNVNQASNWIGKCCPVQSGRWISGWVRRALEGNPGRALIPIGDREYLHDNTLLYKQWLKEQEAK